MIGWRYLSSATCLIRSHLFDALFVVSRIITIRSIIHHNSQHYSHVSDK